MHPSFLHPGLLGRDPHHTPAEYQATPRQKKLYERYPEVLGYAQTQQDPEIFLATLIMALAQTDLHRSRQVVLFTPKPMRPWVIKQIETVFRYAVRCRRGERDNLKALQEAFGQVFLSHQFLQLAKEPDHWVAFGIVPDSIIPTWLAKKLTDDTSL